MGKSSRNIYNDSMCTKVYGYCIFAKVLQGNNYAVLAATTKSELSSQEGSNNVFFSAANPYHIYTYLPHKN